MTVFDRIEAQLLDAHPHRSRRAIPRPAPRTLLAFAATAAAVVAVAVAGLAGGSSTATRGGDGSAAASPLTGRTVAVVNAGGAPGAAGRVAGRLTRRGIHVVLVGNARVTPCQGVVVYFRHGQSAAAFRVAELLGTPVLLPADAALVRAARSGAADVIVVVGT